MKDITEHPALWTSLKVLVADLEICTIVGVPSDASGQCTWHRIASHRCATACYRRSWHRIASSTIVIAKTWDGIIHHIKQIRIHFMMNKSWACTSQVIFFNIMSLWPHIRHSSWKWSHQVTGVTQSKLRFHNENFAWPRTTTCMNNMFCIFGWTISHNTQRYGHLWRVLLEI